jgi:D-alanyl-lipoteichoic acid acyltransferase DltB (MBOAT superfamily)
LTAPEILLGVYAFAFQIYGDFSGYSNIARGISKWLGFELVVNFHMPYLAVSPSDLWRRWHISLSSWLRDYLYIPLGGSRKGEWMTYRNLMLTMFLGGLWHGADWTYVAWGLYHGAILCLFRLLKIVDPVPGGNAWQRIRWAVRAFIMFHLTCFGWLLFRADSLHTVARMCVDLTTNVHFNAAVLLPPLAMILFFCALSSVIECYTDGETRLDRLLAARWEVQGAVVVYWVVMMLFFQAEGVHEFIYFQF